MRTATIAGLTLLLLPGVAHADIPAGEATYRRQDYGAAFLLLKPDADASNARPNTSLASCSERARA